jgi:hypothetical protein
MLETAADRRQFLKAAGDGPGELDGRSVPCIFDITTQILETFEGAISSQRIAAQILEADIGAARRGSVFRYRGTDYHVENIERDGTGFADLVLSRAT